jgi:hypothetical protein
MEQETRGQEMPEWLMYRHSWKPFLNMSVRFACFMDAALFCGKEQNTWSWSYSQVPDYQDFQISR